MVGVSVEDRCQLAVYKVKKWALQIVQRVHSRFGDQKLLKRTSNRDRDGDTVARAFGQRFLDSWAARLTELLLVLLQQHLQQQTWITPRMQNLVLQFLALAVESAALYRPLIKPHGQLLVFDFCLPLLHYSAEDEETWLAEPLEYIRRQNDPLEAFSQPREAGENGDSHECSSSTSSSISGHMHAYALACMHLHSCACVGMHWSVCMHMCVRCML